MDTWLILTMACVGVGFLFFGAAFFGYMSKWEKSIIWGLCIGAFVLVTVIPVIIAVSHAATTTP
ncbi:hypothetical protein [Corynebacterium sp. H78]|uniref:hypothetical protein n=1 Tax=Corynebacterium sp. H78 TaxID=3133417 RepID=UPI0030A15860